MHKFKNVKFNVINFGFKKLTGVAIVFGKNNPKAGCKYSVGNYD